jgi:Mg2+ and Co2+ transporter CorA
MEAVRIIIVCALMTIAIIGYIIWDLVITHKEKQEAKKRKELYKLCNSRNDLTALRDILNSYYDCTDKLEENYKQLNIFFLEKRCYRKNTDRYNDTLNFIKLYKKSIENYVKQLSFLSRRYSGRLEELKEYCNENNYDYSEFIETENLLSGESQFEHIIKNNKS